MKCAIRWPWKRPFRIAQAKRWHNGWCRIAGLGPAAGNDKTQQYPGSSQKVTKETKQHLRERVPYGVRVNKRVRPMFTTTRELFVGFVDFCEQSENFAGVRVCLGFPVHICGRLRNMLAVIWGLAAACWLRRKPPLVPSEVWERAHTSPKNGRFRRSER